MWDVVTQIKNANYEKTINSETTNKEFANKKILQPGEHIISVPVSENQTKANMQYQNFKGYEAVGIATFSYDKYLNVFGGSCILYVNTAAVRCNSTSFKNNKYYFINFEIPLENEQVLKLIN